MWIEETKGNVNVPDVLITKFELKTRGNAKKAEHNPSLDIKVFTAITLQLSPPAKITRE